MGNLQTLYASDGITPSPPIGNPPPATQASQQNVQQQPGNETVNNNPGTFEDLHKKCKGMEKSVIFM